MAASKVSVLVVAAFLAAQGPSALGQEIISDLADVVMPSPADERVALEAKAEEFWRTVLDAADGMKMTEHFELYVATEKVIAELPQENEYVRTTLKDVLVRLRRADEMVLKNAVQSSDLASQKLSTPAGQTDFFSFFSGGQNFLTTALRRFVAGGRYPERLLEHVGQRQADILPVLRGAADSAGNVLQDTRLASKLSFDVLKYDIYNKGVPKTPQTAKDIAYKLVDAAGGTRHHFMQFVTQAANSIAKDTTGKHDSATATAAQAQLRAAQAKVSATAMEQVINV